MPRVARPAALTAGGVQLTPTPLYDGLWRYAAARQALFLRRAAGAPPPWTDDPILRCWRFTNVYRASDRVSQCLIRSVIYAGDQDPLEVAFRTLLFRSFNLPETWWWLVAALGEQPSWARTKWRALGDALDARRAAGHQLYTGAYYVRAPLSYGAGIVAHHLHLARLKHLMTGGAVGDALRAPTLALVVAALRSVLEVGPFLSWQFALDLNYGPAVNHDEDEPGAVVAGPGAVDGLSKCFVEGVRGAGASAVIGALAARAPAEFARLRLDFPTLWGRPLTAADVEHLLCEYSKYTRAAAPAARGSSGSFKIRARFRAGGAAPLEPQWYPPKWGINEAARRWHEHRHVA